MEPCAAFTQDLPDDPLYPVLPPGDLGFRAFVRTNSGKIGTLVCWDGGTPGRTPDRAAGCSDSVLSDSHRLASCEKAEFGEAQYDVADHSTAHALRRRLCGGSESRWLQSGNIH
jgi:hypothetical protein